MITIVATAIVPLALNPGEGKCVYPVNFELGSLKEFEEVSMYLCCNDLQHKLSFEILWGVKFNRRLICSVIENTIIKNIASHLLFRTLCVIAVSFSGV